MDLTSMNQGMWMIILVTVLILCILLFKQHAEILLNIMLRGVFGAILIYFINQTLLLLHIGTVVGFNLLSLVTSAVLGIPGVVLLYGIMMI